MNPERIDELLAKLGDEGLTTSEVQEAETALAAASPAGRLRAHDFLAVEAGLRRSRRLNDASGQVMSALAAKESSFVNRIMNDVAQREKGAQAKWRQRTQPPRHRGRWGVGIAGFIALCAGLSFAFVSRPQRSPPASSDPLISQTPRTPATPPPRFLSPNSGTTAPSIRQGPEPTPLVSLDFEDGLSPSYLRAAVVVPGLPRARHGFVVMGGLSKLEPRENLIQFDFGEAGHRLRFSKRTVVSFDIWVGGEVKRLAVQFFNKTKFRNYHWIFTDFDHEKWQRVTVRLADLVVNDGSGIPSVEGDAMDHLIVLGGRLLRSGLFLDNLRVVEFPPQVPLPPTRISDEN